jgi:hypothetical protein
MPAAVPRCCRRPRWPRLPRRAVLAQAGLPLRLVDDDVVTASASAAARFDAAAVGRRKLTASVNAPFAPDARSSRSTRLTPRTQGRSCRYSLVLDGSTTSRRASSPTTRRCAPACRSSGGQVIVAVRSRRLLPLPLRGAAATGRDLPARRACSAPLRRRRSAMAETALRLLGGCPQAADCARRPPLRARTTPARPAVRLRRAPFATLDRALRWGGGLRPSSTSLRCPMMLGPREAGARGAAPRQSRRKEPLRNVPHGRREGTCPSADAR